MCNRNQLARVAREQALLPWHGFLPGEPSNLWPIVRFFPKWSLLGADRLWCAAFVYFCCQQAGFQFPYSPRECVSCSLAGCGGWEDFAKGDERIGYHVPSESDFSPEPGDIVLFDYVFCNEEHDHIGIVIEVGEDFILTAEGNHGNSNQSGIFRWPRDHHIRAYIRIPDGYTYEGKKMK